MIDYLRSHLFAKLLLSYIVILLVCVIVLVSASQSILPTAFDRHMSSMGSGMMGGSGSGMMPGLFVDFRASFNEALTYAVIASLAVAVAVGVFFSRRVTAPLLAMQQATQRIAEGHYDDRVRVQTADELGQLALRFNQMAEKLEQVEAMRRRLIGDVSHELRTPLTAIKGSMEGLMDGVLPATNDTYQQLHMEADRLNRLVDDLQELSRVEAHASQLDIQRVDFANVVQTVAKRVSAQLESKRLSLDLDLPADPPPVQADEDRTVQVLTNLVNNAIQYTNVGGTITISVARLDGALQVSVRDTGVGISAEHLPHIFDRFYRVDKSRSRRAGGGSGIGLTIAKHIVEQQGGKIWVDSDGESKGSVFVFTLPLA